ncbi:hypothetical protein HanPSC8_Chr03g0085231 [Helianthus annuus]|nr:hypothetical protein HanPSC8_Chr03g0085231 [Helianthus annuus]
MLGNCTSLPDPFGVDLLSSVIQRGLCDVRERNGAVGIALPSAIAGGSGFRSVFWFLFFFALCGLMLGYSLVLLLPPLVLLIHRRR